MKWIVNILYNFDRTIASIFGAPPEETISSEIGRHHDPVSHAAGEVLDHIQKGHVEEARAHADVLDKADADYYAKKASAR